MKLIGGVICLVLFVGCTGSPCSDLSGTWRNQLGSNMTINIIEDGSRITGRYYTSVESTTGASRISTKITGLIKPVEDGSLLAFNVLWNRGASLTAWVGQCIVCDGQPKLHTTWLLRSLQQPLHKRWMSTRVNQDTFYRVDAVESTPQPGDAESSANSGLFGKWISTSGDSFNITRASESGHGVEGSRPSGPGHSTLFGQDAGNQTYTALGMVAASPSQIQGWTGHIYNPQDTIQELETSWLSQEFSSECNNPRKFVKFGMDYYRKDSADSTA